MENSEITDDNANRTTCDNLDRDTLVFLMEWTKKKLRDKMKEVCTCKLLFDFINFYNESYRLLINNLQSIINIPHHTHKFNLLLFFLSFIFSLSLCTCLFWPYLAYNCSNFMMNTISVLKHIFN